MMSKSPRALLGILAATVLLARCGGVGHTVGSAVASDGVTIRYEAAGGGEPAIVFVHGWSCDRSYWRTQIDHFSAFNRVVAIDLGGHGESGLNRKNWTIASFADDVRSVVDALNLRKVVLVGHSMGGSVVMEAATIMRERVVAVIPVDSFTSAPTQEDRERVFPTLLEALRADFRTATEEMVKKFMLKPNTDPELAERIVRDMASAPPAVAISAIENYLDEADTLTNIKPPVRLINADLSPTDLALWRRGKADVSLAVMPGVGHFVMLEDGEEFNRLLANAVRDLVVDR